MWLLFALGCFGAWGAADLFYKKSSSEEVKYSHIKTSITVGFIMGLVAIFTIIIEKVDYNPINLLIYLPVSSMYILSMTIGYFGLRYLELSVSSPIQNASGAVSLLIMILVLKDLPSIPEWVAIGFITIGVIMLGVLEKKKEALYELKTNKKYKIGFVAFLMPILYCVIDSIGTALDGIYLDDLSTSPLVGITEDSIETVANVSYMLTFFICSILLSIYVYIIKKQPFSLEDDKPRLLAGGFETIGQIAYAYAMSGNGLIAAPVISSYCVASVILARIFLKEKLTVKQYMMILLVFIGIAILGVLEGLDS